MIFHIFIYNLCGYWNFHINFFDLYGYLIILFEDDVTL